MKRQRLQNNINMISSFKKHMKRKDALKKGWKEIHQRLTVVFCRQLDYG